MWDANYSITIANAWHLLCWSFSSLHSSTEPFLLMLRYPPTLLQKSWIVQWSLSWFCCVWVCEERVQRRVDILVQSSFLSSQIEWIERLLSCHNRNTIWDHTKIGIYRSSMPTSSCMGKGAQGRGERKGLRIIVSWVASPVCVCVCVWFVQCSVYPCGCVCVHICVN